MGLRQMGLVDKYKRFKWRFKVGKSVILCQQVVKNRKLTHKCKDFTENMKQR